MSQTANTTTRAQFLHRAFPLGVPRLWGPPLTHYDQHGVIDASRIARHLQHLSPYVGGFLIPGSTGDGWELTRAERRQVLEIGLKQARQLNAQVLIGALHPEASQALALIREDLDWLTARHAGQDLDNALAQAHVCGFTVCPPRGQQLTQEEIGRTVSAILDLGLPTAIYQLPQITLNEMGADLTADLAQRYENFIFFKDTSGTDAVVRSGKNLGGVFTARGAEGDYARWLGQGGGYDGFLLASANCFARELHLVIADLHGGRVEQARRLSERLTAATTELLRLAGRLPHGNPFTNANKAFDHFFAHGPEAASATSPRLHAGSSLPPDFIRSAERILLRERLMPPKGYLE